ncbi:MAG: orotidine-5'-phosphate decarboxylase [Acidiferrobacterales bacterium]
MTNVKKARPRVILALDYADGATALSLVRKLNNEDCRLKIGLELYTAAGNDFVRELVDSGFDVFLDLKFHDIPNTVAQTCSVVASLGVWMINVHALGGPAMMRAAREAIDTCSHQPLLIGVTILTSHGGQELTSIGIDGDPTSAVLRLSRLTQESGLDGIVCSPHEVSLLRSELGEDFKLVTPGVRPQGSNADDQQRIMTPAEAIAQGSDYLVIGRPVTQADDPVRALDVINQQLSGQPRV